MRQTKQTTQTESWQRIATEYKEELERKLYELQKRAYEKEQI